MITKASLTPPADVSPAKVPSVCPATYTPDESTEIPRGTSEPDVPNWLVQITVPLVSYLRIKASLPPAVLSPGRVPPVTPTT